MSSKTACRRRTTYSERNRLRYAASEFLFAHFQGRKLDKLLQEAKEDNEALKNSKEELGKQLALVNVRFLSLLVLLFVLIFQEEVERLSLSLRQQTRSVNTLEGVEKSLREQIESLNSELRTKSVC